MMKIWLDGDIVDEKHANVPVASHALHYGTCAFEGVRFYQTKDGPAIFRLSDHLDRLQYSARRLGMYNSIPGRDVLEHAIAETVVANEASSGYIRPIIFYGGGGLGLSTEHNHVSTAVIVMPWEDYLTKHGITVKTSSWYRISPYSFDPEAKIGGQYVNSVLANQEARLDGSDEALLLDQWGNVAEGSGENIFYVDADTIYTPQKGSILPGITRDTVMTLAHDLGYGVKEKKCTLEEFKNADEVFMVGTAAEITPVTKIDDATIGQGGIGPLSHQIDGVYANVVRGAGDEKYREWLTFVSR